MDNTVPTLRQELKLLKKKQGVLSRAIGALKKQQQDFQKQLSEMQALSLQIKSIENQIGQLNQSLDVIKCKEKKDIAENKSLPYRTLQPNKNYSIDLQQVVIKQIDQNANQWDAFLESTKNYPLYYKLAWRELIQAQFGHQVYYFYAESETGEWLGVLPLIEMNSRLFGHFFVSIPYFNYGGALGVTTEVEALLMAEANRVAKKRGASHVEYRDEISRPDIPVRTDKVSMILPLKSNRESLMASFSAKLRSQIKRSCEQNFQLSIGGKECLSEFYRVFSRNMRDLGTPVYSKLFFKKILETFEENTHIVVVKHQGSVVSAAFLMRHNDCMEVPWASTIREANKLNANMFLYWKLLGFACEQECKYFDFGRSTKGAGTYKFKKQWGAIEKPLFWHYWLADGKELPQLNPDNPKYRLLIRIWKLLPVWLTMIIGPYVVKNLP